MRAVPDTRAIRSRADKALGRRSALQDRLRQVEVDILALEDEEEALTLVAELYRHLIDQEVTVGVKAVEKLLTEGLQTVFDDQDLQVEAEVETQRGKISVDLLTVQTHADGTVVRGLARDAYGGSVATVQSVLLRLIVILRRGLRRYLQLDETLPAFDSNYMGNAGQFLALLCRRLHIDILAVTHNPMLAEAAHREYRMVPRGGSTKVDRVR